MASEKEPMLKVICEINNYEHLQMLKKKRERTSSNYISFHNICLFQFSATRKINPTLI